MILSIDPGTRNLGYAILQRGLLFACGVCDVNGDATSSTIKNTVTLVKSLLSEHAIELVIVERQPPRAYGDTVAVAHACVAAAFAAGVRAQLKHAIRHGGRGTSYSSRKRESQRLFLEQLSPAGLQVLQGVPRAQRVHVGDAYHLGLGPSSEVRVKLEV